MESFILFGIGTDSSSIFDVILMQHTQPIERTGNKKIFQED